MIRVGWLIAWGLFGVVCVIAFGLSARAARADVPAPAMQYQRMLLREARAALGLQAPVALFAGQIEQESGWNPHAQSSFASGLAQFTPQTAAWIKGAYRSELGGDRGPESPEWAIRALVIYDQRLYSLRVLAGVGPDCDHWAFALSAYNGGPGWIGRDQSLCAAAGCDPERWWGAVERYSARAASAMRENRDYPRRILLRNQAHYEGWGGVVSCTSSSQS